MSTAQSLRAAFELERRLEMAKAHEDRMASFRKSEEASHPRTEIIPSATPAKRKGKTQTVAESRPKSTEPTTEE